MDGDQPSHGIGDVDGEQGKHQRDFVVDGAVVAADGDRYEGAHRVRDRSFASPAQESTERARDGRQRHVVDGDLEGTADIVDVVEGGVCDLVAAVGPDRAGERRPRRGDERGGERRQARDGVRDTAHRPGRGEHQSCHRAKLGDRRQQKPACGILEQVQAAEIGDRFG